MARRTNYFWREQVDGDDGDFRSSGIVCPDDTVIAEGIGPCEGEIAAEELTLLNRQSAAIAEVVDRVYWKSWFGRLLCYALTGHRNPVNRSDSDFCRLVCRGCGHIVERRKTIV